MQTIYIEKHLKSHPKTEQIISRFKHKSIIYCDHYGEIFNRKQQDFRLQKNNPAIILAEKKGRKVLPTPPGFGIGGNHNFYFSHMQNCPFDCRYCFLQGMYQSAHYLIFINHESFIEEIYETVNNSQESCYFFSGYDADSLAYEPVTGFLNTFIPAFAKIPNSFLELRTKSANVKQLLKFEAQKNVIVAFSLNPKEIINSIEEKTPKLEKRLKALKQVAEHGYPVGLRFDPLIYCEDYKRLYSELMESITSLNIPIQQIHSISIGTLRFPEKMHKKIHKLYPKSALLNQQGYQDNKIISYPPKIDEEIKEFMLSTVKDAFHDVAIFSCNS
jgi:spore photoproduct lyase